MARKVIWSFRAQIDRKQIFVYWNKRNGSNTYSKKLNRLFIETVDLISKFPDIGKLTNDQSARIKVVDNYLIIYEEINDLIFILTIWDSRQNPNELMNIIKE
jgi:plasmid stabilization system protein ParE